MVIGWIFQHEVEVEELIGRALFYIDDLRMDGYSKGRLPWANKEGLRGFVWVSSDGKTV